MSEENQKFKENNEKLSEEVNRMGEENNKLAENNQNLANEINRLKAEIDRMVEEKKICTKQRKSQKRGTKYNLLLFISHLHQNKNTIDGIYTLYDNAIVNY